MGSESPHPILLYGDSLLLAAVESQLRAHPNLQVIQIDSAHSTATEQLASLGQGVLLYDARVADPELIKAIHVLHPRIPTVGLEGGDGQRDFRQPQLLPAARGLAQCFTVLISIHKVRRHFQVLQVELQDIEPFIPLQAPEHFASPTSIMILPA